MPDFIFQETGLADRLETYVPSSPKRVYFPTTGANAWVYRDPARLDQEFKEKWGETGDAAGFRADEARVVAFLQQGFRAAVPPDIDDARAALGDALTRLWITGSAADLLAHYFTAERTKIYLAMTVTESGPVSLADPSSAFTLPLMDAGSVFGGYYGFVKPGLWRLTEELAAIDREIGVEFTLAARVERVDPERGTSDTATREWTGSSPSTTSSSLPTRRRRPGWSVTRRASGGLPGNAFSGRAADHAVLPPAGSVEGWARSQSRRRVPIHLLNRDLGRFRAGHRPGPRRRRRLRARVHPGLLRRRRDAPARAQSSHTIGSPSSSRTWASAARVRSSTTSRHG